MLMWTWWMGLPLAFLALVVALWLRPSQLPRRERYGLGCALALALFLVALPAWRWVLLRGVAWMYTDAPPTLTRWVMPSRQVLSLAHYQNRVVQGLQTLAQMDTFALTLLLLLLGMRFLGLYGRERPLWVRRLRRGGMLAVLIPVALLTLGWAGTEVGFRLAHPVFYTGCPKIWGHRGHPEPPEIPENTIASFQRAFDLGAPGVEMDVAYLRETRQFLIRRPDREYPQHLTLEEVFAAVGTRGYFWLDIKTIRELSPQEAQQAARDLRALVDRFDLRERVIVESEDPNNLRYFARAGLHTSYWIFNIDETEFPSSSWQLFWTLQNIRWNYIRGGFSAISMDVRFYTPQVAQALKGARIHLFTVNDPATLRALAQREEVRVILTDTDLYRLVECP